MQSKHDDTKIDNRFNRETAEGIDIFLVPAGIGPRSLAFVLDLLIRGAIMAAAGMALGAMGKFGSGLMFIVYFVVDWFYPVIFEVFKGATPGKSAFKLRVVYDSGLPITLPGSIIRNLFRTIDFLPFGYVLGTISMVSSAQCKRVGDWVAGSLVVYTDKQKDVNESTSLIHKPISLKLNEDEQVAIIAFLERSKQLSKSRKKELAKHLCDALDCSEDKVVEHVAALASNLVGKA